MGQRLGRGISVEIKHVLLRDRVGVHLQGRLWLQGPALVGHRHRPVSEPEAVVTDEVGSVARLSPLGPLPFTFLSVLAPNTPLGSITLFTPSTWDSGTHDPLKGGLVYPFLSFSASVSVTSVSGSL